MLWDLYTVPSLVTEEGNPLLERGALGRADDEACDPSFKVAMAWLKNVKMTPLL